MASEKSSVSNLRVTRVKPLIPPAIIHEEISAPEETTAFIIDQRHACSNVLSGLDDRLLCVVGPCSIHDVVAAREYALKLAKVAQTLKDDLVIVMRVYFEKPRTTVGWKGLINDPDLDGSFQINKGLKLARQLLLDINEMKLPVGCELLDTISPQFIADLITWGAIGARTTESQLHRELVSGLSFPVGFKNGSSGAIQVAVDGMMSAAGSHSFLGVSEQGLAAIVQTAGNMDTHIILRGGADGPNYSAVDIEKASKRIQKSFPNRSPAIVIDASHGNSGKDHKKQPLVIDSVCNQVARGNTDIKGIMVESNLVEGSQKLVVGPGAAEGLEYGKSITDKCANWEDTEKMLSQLARAVQARRAATAPKSKL